MLSILIPVFNYDASPLVQELKEQIEKLGISYEIIVLNDASTSFLAENQTLKNKGLKAVLSDGQTFDPEMHEAITEIEMGPNNKGKIIDTVERGYTLNDHIVKYAKVVVGK